MKENKRYKMRTVKGVTYVFEEGSNNVKEMGEGKEGAANALMYLEIMRLINRTQGTYQTASTACLYPVKGLVPSLKGKKVKVLI